MDTTNIDDKMVRQIEKNLSNNLNENLFSTGRIFESDRKSGSGKSAFDNTDSVFDSEKTTLDYSGEMRPYTNQSTLTRAEYIRQAREACLRQMSALQYSSSHSYEAPSMDAQEQSSDLFSRRKPRGLKLYHDGGAADENNDVSKAFEEDTPQEIASFRSLIIRTACAILIFVCVFIIDKLQFTVGKFSYEMINQFVTGNDALLKLQGYIVSWLK